MHQAWLQTFAQTNACRGRSPRGNVRHRSRRSTAGRDGNVFSNGKAPASNRSAPL